MMYLGSLLFAVGAVSGLVVCNDPDAGGKLLAAIVVVVLGATLTVLGGQ